MTPALVQILVLSVIETNLRVICSGDYRPNMFGTKTTKDPASASYGVYLWNGKDADAVVKATALTKAFQLERTLHDDSNIERLFNCDTATVSLQSVLKPGFTQNLLNDSRVTAIAETNELFRWLLQVKCHICHGTY